MSSRLLSEARWFLANYAILIAVAFAFGLVQGAWIVAGSAGSSLEGWSGPPAQQVFWWAVAVVIFGPLVLGIPFLLVGLATWRLTIRRLGRPRLSAYVVAAVVVALATVLIPRTNVPSIVGYVVIPVFTFASVARVPSET